MSVAQYQNRFSPESLRETLISNYGVSADAEMPRELRFARGVASVAKRRFRDRGEVNAQLPIIFLLHPGDLPYEVDGRDVRRVHMLDNGLSALGGSVWFVNYAVTEGVALSATDSDSDATLFDLVRGPLGLGETPAVVLETRGGLFELRYFPDGLAHPETCDTSDLAETNITVEDIYETITDIWLKNLITPTAQTTNAGTWVDAGDLLPNQHAEQRVQNVLRAGLGQRFKGFNIRQEQTQVSGRLDLEIEEQLSDDPTKVIRHAVLELKVLRAKTEGGKTVLPKAVDDAISEGLNQARAYRDERQVRLAALCCFDMRSAPPAGDAAYDHVRSDAAAWNVNLWIWHLFNSSGAWRTHTRPSSESMGADVEHAADG